MNESVTFQTVGDISVSLELVGGYSVSLSPTDYVNEPYYENYAR